MKNLTLELTGFYEAQRNSGQMQRFVTSYIADGLNILEGHWCTRARIESAPWMQKKRKKLDFLEEIIEKKNNSIG